MSETPRLIVHGRATSSNVQAVMWGIAELGLEAERRDVGGRFGGNDTPEFRAISPMGLVPAFQDGDDVTLFESAAILRYLCARYGAGSGLDHGPEADAWAEWSKHTLCRTFTLTVFWGYYRTPEPERDMETVIAGLREYERLAGIAMARRGKNRFLLGETLSLADVWAGHVLYRYFTLDLPQDVPAGLREYYDDLCSNPNYATHVMVDYSELRARTAA
jgi:glutathione S-transferase